MKWICSLFGHQYGVVKEFTPFERMLGCKRCRKTWAMNDKTQSLLDWDSDFTELYAAAIRESKESK